MHLIQASLLSREWEAPHTVQKVGSILHPIASTDMADCPNITSSSDLPKTSGPSLSMNGYTLASSLNDKIQILVFLLYYYIIKIKE